jgi:hypothetical protein
MDRDSPEPLRFVLSDLVADETARAFAEHERRIRESLPHVEVRHRGGSAKRAFFHSLRNDQTR